MFLSIDKCYAVMFEDGVIARFRFKGCNEDGQVMIELPPGNQIPFYDLLGTKKWLLYWEISEI